MTYKYLFFIPLFIGFLRIIDLNNQVSWILEVNGGKAKEEIPVALSSRKSGPNIAPKPQFFDIRCKKTGPNKTIDISRLSQFLLYALHNQTI